MRLLPELELQLDRTLNSFVLDKGWQVLYKNKILRVNNKTSWKTKGAAKSAVYAKMKYTIMQAVAKDRQPGSTEPLHYYNFQKEAYEYYETLLERNIIQIIAI